MSTHHQAAEAPHPVAEIARVLDLILATLNQRLWGVAIYATLLGPIFIAVHNRIHNTRQRLARALARLAAGDLPKPRPRTAPRKPGARVPFPNRRHGWLGFLLDHNIRSIAGQLQHALHQPGIAALLAQSPGAARTLRPLAHMLGAELPSALRLPPRPRPEKPPRLPRAPRPSPAPLDPPLQPPPLQPYVARAVRWLKRNGLFKP